MLRNGSDPLKSYILQNLDCAQCALNLENNLKKREDVRDVAINFAASTMMIDTDNISRIRLYIQEIEPAVTVVEKEDPSLVKIKMIKNAVFLGILAGFFAAGIVFQDFLHTLYQEIPEYLFFIGLYLAAGWQVLYRAGKNIIRGNIFDENFLMAVATIAAIAIHAIPEAVGVMIFYKLGEFLEDLALQRSRKSIRSLLSIRPDSATLVTPDGYEVVSPQNVKVGELILVKPGERVPLDGTVVAGTTQVDTSALTGESVPRNVGENEQLLSGSIVMTGAVTIRVEKTFKESSVSRILDLVENAVKKKAKTEKFITSFARIYTPIIVGLAIFIALVPPFIFGNGTFSDWLYRACVILVISCPCALVISIPLGYFGGIGAASRRGILVKGSNFIDILSRVDTVVFDKTGTLTKGVFQVSEIVTRNGFTQTELLKYAAFAEAHSNHPAGTAILKAYGKNIDTETISSHREVAGRGVVVTAGNREIVVGNDRFLHELNIEHEDCHLSKTVAYTAVDHRYAGYIIISDEIKPDAKNAVSMLSRAGIKRTVLLTGDNADTARDISEMLGIDEYHARLLPEEKVRELEIIMAEAKKKVVFVGDGINDAPVIALADAGIAMGRLGSDAAIETADVVLMTDAPSKVAEAILLSRRTRRIVFQNIFLALAIKLLFVALGTIGLAGMWEAVFADVGVTLLAILNSLRVLRPKIK
ncbi:MAG: cadmium-translocating P-type ATPase [Spirochaetales bacterium]|nr:cadmium-translocating P-type ATPase [Spirochaetales bacterium]